MERGDGNCDMCGGHLDHHAENGTCFECIMNSCIPGNYNK